MRKSIGMGKELYSSGRAEQRIGDVELQVLLDIVDITQLVGGSRSTFWGIGMTHIWEAV